MGNRGVLHDAEGRIKRAWQLRRWIVCVLEFRGRKRQVMTPGRYLTSWDGTDNVGSRSRSGMYFMRIQVGSQKITSRMVLMQ